MTKQNNKGFSHIETFLVLLVIVVIGAVGFSVHKRSTGSKFANAEGCPVAAGNQSARSRHYSVNKQVFIKDNGSEFLWVWKNGGASEDPDATKPEQRNNLRKQDLRILYTSGDSSSLGWIGAASWRDRCNIERKCGAEATSDSWMGPTVRYCEVAERNKQVAKHMPGMKKIYSDNKTFTVKACRDSSNPAKPIRFAVFDNYTRAKKIVENYEKNNSIKFKAAAIASGYTPERWRRMTVYDPLGSDKERAVAIVQSYLYGFDRVDSNVYDVNEAFVANLVLNPGKTRPIWSGPTKSASIQRIRSRGGVTAYTLRQPRNNVNETIVTYAKIEGYAKKANGGETNPIVKFTNRYIRRTPTLQHWTDWLGTHPLNPNNNDEGELVTKTIKTRFKSLSKCGSKMFPANYYEEAKIEGWDS